MNDAPAAPSTDSEGKQVLFWGCFIALVTTSFAFISRIYLCTTRFGTEFNLDKAQVGELIGAGIWPFAISIILFSLVIDRIGYRIAMLFSFVCYAIYLVMACLAYAAIQGVTGDAAVEARATGFNYLYFGSIILALGNGTVEAFINPVVATIFTREKTKWLNILHAGWPGGLVLGGIITIAMADTAKTGDWRLVLGIIALPAVVYLLMLIAARFPKTEREEAGVTYREMLGEFGAFGAMIGFGLIFIQLWQEGNKMMESPLPIGVPIALTAVVTVAFGVYTGSIGRGIMALLIIIMMPLATTEIGTDSWITGLMETPMKEAGYNAGWVLVYTSAIMMVLRFFAGPIVHKFSPVGLLVVSAALAVGGLLALSQTGGAGLAVIFLAATLYGIGKTFFWPTMLGVTSEQCPKGGALTLNAISGIGMIAVGVLGQPFIGAIQERKTAEAIRESDSELLESSLEKKAFLGFDYEQVPPKRVDALKESEDPDEKQAATTYGEAETKGKLGALGIVALFPTFMLICYLAMFAYFKSKGGYKAEVLTGHAAEDEKFTGGVEAPADR